MPTTTYITLTRCFAVPVKFPVIRAYCKAESSASMAFLQAASADTGSTASHTQTDSNPAAAADSSVSAAAASEQRWRAALSKTPAKQGEEVWGRSPHLGAGWKCVSDASAVTEVHLRRLDVGDDLHRRVVAVLTVDATPQEVCMD